MNPDISCRSTEKAQEDLTDTAPYAATDPCGAEEREEERAGKGKEEG
jgi:hypothetical protein